MRFGCMCLCLDCNLSGLIVVFMKFLATNEANNSSPIKGYTASEYQ